MTRKREVLPNLEVHQLGRLHGERFGVLAMQPPRKRRGQIGPYIYVVGYYRLVNTRPELRYCLHEMATLPAAVHQADSIYEQSRRKKVRLDSLPNNQPKW